jgi:Beta-propeller repeat
MPLRRASNNSLLALISFPLLVAACGGGGSSSTGGGGGPVTSGNGGDGGGRGGGGGATSTGGTECTPGEMGACYSGPPETKGVGLCVEGTRTCKDDGNFGPCVGEVTPTAETCSTMGDDNCNGSVNESGSGCICVPGTTVPCYSGPAASVGIGICKAGVQTCKPDGLGLGPCQGEVVPAAEDCLAPADEDCNGDTLTCTGNQVWAKRYGDAAAQTATGVAAKAGGAVFVGSLAGVTNFGGGVLTSAGATDVFVAAVDTLGLPLWSKIFGDVAAQTATRVAVDAKGNVAVLGDFAGKIDFGGGALTSAGATDVFVAKFDSTGAFLWAKAFGNNLAQNGFDIAFAPNGDVVFTGSFTGTINFGGGALTSAGATDLFVARLDPAGAYIWGQRFGDAGAQAGKGVTVDSQGNVIVTGDIAGKVDFGGGELTSAGATDVLLLKLDPAGAHVYSKLFGNASAQNAAAVAVDAVGNMVIAGSAAGKVDFGGGMLTSLGGTDIFVAKLTAGGVHLWSKLYGAAGNQDARDIAVDPNGAILVAGDFTTTADFGGGVLTSAGVADGFIAKLDPFGAHVWSKKQGDASAQSMTSIAVDGTGVFAAGTFSGVVNFGGAALTSAGATDVMVAKLAP